MTEFTEADVLAMLDEVARQEANGWPPGETPGLVTLSTVTPERVSWLWPGRLPRGKLVVLDGDPSTGKSTLMLDLAARVTRGGPWPDGSTSVDAAGVLVLSAEDGLADTIVPRLASAGADLGRVHALVEVPVRDQDVVRMVPPSLPRDLAMLEQIVTAQSVSLVIVDVLMAYLPSHVDSHRDQDVRGVLHRLAAMAERTGCTVVLVRHLNKAGGSNALYRGGGSIGIVGGARAAFLVARDPDDDDRRILAVTKSNLAAEPPSLAFRLCSDESHGCARVEWEPGTVELTAADLLSRAEAPEERSERDEAMGFLIDFLTERGGTAGAAEVIKAAGSVGIARTTLTRARVRAGVVTNKAGMGGGWVWSIAESLPRRIHEGTEEPSPQDVGSSDSSVDSSEPEAGS